MQPVADRYSYLPTIGLFVLLGAAVAAAWEKGKGMRRLALAAASVTLCVISGRAAADQATHWKSSISLWEPVVARRPARPDYTDAYLNLAAAYAHDGRTTEARETLGRAAVIDPSNAEVAYNLGILFFVEGNMEKALASFRRATENDPRHARAFFNLAIASDNLGRNEEAIEAMVKAARLGSADAQDALRSRGLAW